eukprot:scaffold25830_cov162-Cylindrotheca_fusiformis.AAC.12
MYISHQPGAGPKDTIIVMKQEVGEEEPVFRPSFGSSAASQSEEQAKWRPTAGAFPNDDLDDYVFGDDTTDDSSFGQRRFIGANAPLDVVKEESSNASTEAQISAPKDRQPSLKSPPRETFRPPFAQVDSKTNATSSSGVSDLTYPYALLYNNLAKERGEQESQQNKKNSPNRIPQSSPLTRRQSREPTPDDEASSSPFRMVPIRSASEGSFTVGQFAPSKGRGYNRQQERNAPSQLVVSNPATMLKTLFVGIEQKRHMHRLSAQHMQTIHTWFLFAPAITLTVFTAILIFVFETTLSVNTDGRVYAAIIAGISAFLSAFWQAISRQLDLGTQGALHESCGLILQRLSEDVLRTVSSAQDDDAISAAYVTVVEERFEQALDTCPTTIPYVLESAFVTVSHRLHLMLNPPVGKVPRKKRMSNLEIMRLYANAFDELALEIIHYWAWPLGFPQPRRASEAAVRNFTLMITEGRRSNRMRWVRALFPCWKKPKTRKNLYEIIPTSASVVSAGDQSGGYHTPGRNQIKRPSAYYAGFKSESLGEEV